MSESGQRQTVVKTLKPLDCIPIENPAKPGTPDVNYVEGFIELKWMRRWPIKPETIVRIDHYTVQQRRFGRVRWAKGGHSWLLLQMRREWLLFTGPVADKYVGRVPKQELIGHAHRYWNAGLPQKELIACLTMNLDNWDGFPTQKP